MSPGRGGDIDQNDQNDQNATKHNRCDAYSYNM